MSSKLRCLGIVFAAISASVVAVSRGHADVIANGLRWSDPVVVSGPGAPARAIEIASQKSGRLPTVDEFRAAWPTLAQYSQFSNLDKILHVYFTSETGKQWSVGRQDVHRDSGVYVGLDLVTVVRPANPGLCHIRSAGNGPFHDGFLRMGLFFSRRDSVTVDVLHSSSGLPFFPGLKLEHNGPAVCLGFSSWLLCVDETTGTVTQQKDKDSSCHWKIDRSRPSGVVTLQSLSNSQYRNWYLAAPNDPSFSNDRVTLVPTFSERCLWRIVDVP